MIRAATPEDTPSILNLAVATGMFSPDEIDPVRQTFQDVHSGQAGLNHRVEVWQEGLDGGIVGVTYFCENTMSDHVWDLLMIAVAPERQRCGIGGNLIVSAQQRIQYAGGRMLLIDTSSRPKYDLTRAFYSKHAFVEVARVPDFYSDGESKVIYAKRLISP